MIASFMDLKTAGKAGDSGDLRSEGAARSGAEPCSTRRIEVLKVSRQIDERTREAFDERQKEAVLRERLHQIQKELGDTDGPVRQARGAEASRSKTLAMPPKSKSKRSASSNGWSACRTHPPNTP